MSVPATDTITVVIVDDHLVLADSLASVLGGHACVDVAAVAMTCVDGVRAVQEHQPDVCLLDQRLPDGLGTDLVPALLAASPATKILLLTASDSNDVLHLAVAAGCVGVIWKGRRVAAVLETVLRAAAGDNVLSADDVRRLLPTTGHDPLRRGTDLTSRERDVLGLLVAGVATTEIAQRLFLSPATARNNIQSVIRKLGAHSRLEAVAVALREGIVSAPW